MSEKILAMIKTMFEFSNYSTMYITVIQTN